MAVPVTVQVGPTHRAVHLLEAGIVALLAVTSASAYWGEPKKLGPQVNAVDSTAESLFGRISPDGFHLYFTARHYTHEEDIYVARWNAAIADWDSVTRLPVGPVNSGARDFSPSVTLDGKYLYFTSYGRPGGYGGYDIWYCDWDSVKGDWGDAKNCGPNINHEGTEFTSFIMPDGKRLYFCSTRLGYGQDILYSDWTAAGWGPAQDCGVRGGGYEESPWVSADGTVMYYDAWTTTADRNVYVSRWDGGKWSPGEVVGPPISLPGDPLSADGCPSLSPDRTRLYFATDRNPPPYWRPSSIWVSEWVEGLEEGNRGHLDRCALEALPIPSRGAVTVRYTAPAGVEVKLTVIDVSGRQVASRRLVSPGSGCWRWDGKGGAGGPGVYFVVLRVLGTTRTVKVVRL